MRDLLNLMKKKGCCCDFKEQRDRELLKAFKEEVEASKFIVLDKIWRKLADRPCSRFWISEERAAVVISRMFKGDRLLDMRSPRKVMFNEIFKRVKTLKRQNPGLSIYRLCIMAVNSEAPSFYMTPLSIRQTVYKIRQRIAAMKTKM